MTDARGLFAILFGVSGVGKSTAAEDFARRHPDYLHLRASSLLEEAARLPSEALRRSSETQILGNQKQLAPALARKRAGQEQRPLLLDAHAIIDNDQGLVEVPVEIICQLAPDGLILMDADAEFVFRQRARAVRRRPERSIIQIQEELDRERERVQLFAKTLDVPLQILTVPGDGTLDGAVAKLRLHAATSGLRNSL